MRAKRGVSVRHLSTQGLWAQVVVDGVYRRLGHDLTLTDVYRDVRATPSLHPDGHAFDCRVKDIPKDEWEDLATAIRGALTYEFDVVLKLFPPHIHVEFDPT